MGRRGCWSPLRTPPRWHPRSWTSTAPRPAPGDGQCRTETRGGAVFGAPNAAAIRAMLRCGGRSVMESIYRRLIIPGFESLVKGRDTFRYWRELEESQWWPRERLEVMQLHRLRRHLSHCYEFSPWYRQWWSSLGLKLSALKSLQDFCQWPVTTRAMMRDQASQIRSTARGIHAHAKATGGSSGVPLQFTLERKAAERRMAAVYRGYAWAGDSPRHPADTSLGHFPWSPATSAPLERATLSSMALST